MWKTKRKERYACEESLRRIELLSIDCWEMIEGYKIVRGKEKVKRDSLLLVSSSSRTRGDQIKSACGMSSAWTNFKTPYHKNLWMPIASMIQKAALSMAFTQGYYLWPWIIGSWGIAWEKSTSYLPCCYIPPHKESVDVLGKVGLWAGPVWPFLWSDMDSRGGNLFQQTAQ